MRAASDGQVPALRAAGLQKSFHISKSPHRVLDSVNLSVDVGEFVAIMGPSGCGKTTLLHTLAGLEPPDAGGVRVAGRDIYALSDRARSAWRRDHIGFVLQFFNLVPSLTAAENVALPLRLRGGGWLRARRAEEAVIRERIGALMDQLGLRGLQGHRPEEISGGEQQRIAIARALAVAPDIVCADEPTGNLDYSTGREVMDVLVELCRREHQTTVLVTHDASVAAYADRVLIMRDGSIVDEVRIDHRDDIPGTRPSSPELIRRLTLQSL